MRRRYGGALLCGAVLGFAGAAPAAPALASPRGDARGLVLTLRAPVGCPSPAILRELVAEHLGSASEQLPPLRVQIAVRRTGAARWTARLDVRGSAGGERDLEGATCREVIDAAALVIALAVESQGHVVGQQALPMVLEGEPEVAGAARSGAADAAPAGEVEPRPEPADMEGEGEGERVADAADYDFEAEAVTAEPRRERSQVLTRHTRLAARAGGTGASGVLPGPVAGFDLAISGWRGRHGVELAAGFWPQSVARAGDAGARVGLWTAGVRACRTAAFGAVCAGGELGRMIGRGMNVDNARRAGAMWGALGGSLWLRRRLFGAAAIYAGLEGLLPLTRPRFEVDEATLVHQPWPVAGRVLLGLEFSTR